MKVMYLAWVAIAVAFAALSVSALLNTRWWEVAVCAVGVVAAGTGVGAERQLRLRLAWHKRMLNSQNDEIRRMRAARFP